MIMNNKFKISLACASLVVSAVVAQATVTFNGTALVKVPNISTGDVAYFIIDETNAGFGNLGSINPNTSLFEAGTIYEGATFTIGGDSFGTAFTIVGTKTATGTTTVSVNSTFTNVPLGNGVDSGDKFALIVFETSTTTGVAGDTYRIFTDPTWVVPSDGFTVSFSNTTAGSFAQLGTTASPAFMKTIAATSAVPEPSSFAALAGFAVLGLAASRRRRA